MPSILETDMTQRILEIRREECRTTVAPVKEYPVDKSLLHTCDVNLQGVCSQCGKAPPEPALADCSYC